MTVIFATRNQSKKVTSNQERLENIFHCVDSIKSDLNKCTKMPAEHPIHLFNFHCGCDEIAYKYLPASHELQRRKNSGKYKTILTEVSDFYTTYFPDAQSVLYRIEINSKEQIRGYIFLQNLL